MVRVSFLGIVLTSRTFSGLSLVTGRITSNLLALFLNGTSPRAHFLQRNLLQQHVRPIALSMKNQNVSSLSRRSVRPSRWTAENRSKLNASSNTLVLSL